MTNVCQDDIITRPLSSTVRPSAAFTASADQRIPRPPREIQSVTQRPQPTSSTPQERASSPRVVLIANEEPTARKTLRQLLESANYYVIEADNGRAALGLLSDEVDVVMATLTLPDVSGRDCLRHIRQHFPDIPVILVSRMGEIPEALAVMREGAFECFTRSCHPDQLIARVRQASQSARLAKENRRLRDVVASPIVPVEFVGNSPPMQTLCQQLDTFARLDSSVMITGATGTGKTTAARWIHAHSTRASQPFVVIPCGSLPHDIIEINLFGQSSETGYDRPGLIEIADGGTLLLDEIGNLPLPLQERLLSFLQERAISRSETMTPLRIDTRVIATTGEDPSLLCRQGRLREDLLFRLDILSVRMPQLREHTADIPKIAEAVIRRIAGRYGCAPPALAVDAIEALGRHDWPGNIKELEMVLEQSFVFCRSSTITRKNLMMLNVPKPEGRTTESGAMGLAGFTLAEIERCAIIETMQACSGNKAKTARKLGVSEKTVYNKIKQYNLRGVV